MDKVIRGMNLNSSSFMELLCGTCSITYVINYRCCSMQLILGNVCRTIIEWTSEEAKRDKQKINDFLRKAYGLGCVNLEIIPCESNPCNESSKIQGIIDDCIDKRIDDIKRCLHKSLMSSKGCDDINPLPPPPPNPRYYRSTGGCC